ncbi:hypothetical protein C5167_011025 [Papaver somniferum]|uniref:DUF241 domain-containing protein n=1 Tax=Papaver somniferum TaxID=3469 RepID=A0A4Y7K5U5_PAPSO|nr:uncharacterized protein LOC113291582 [Papaver somniferum]RZC67338.1 hypothetical protein C5167_011025 [Papaver somniferum]
MVISSLKPKTPFHSRSISFPPRSNNPLTLPVEEQLFKLKSSSSLSDEATSTLSPLASMCHKLSGLKDLFNCIDQNLLQSTTTHRVLANKCVNDVLDGTLALLDTCSNAQEVLLQVKECIQDLQLSLRRRRTRDYGHLIDTDVEKYTNSKKKVIKAINRCLKDLKRMENRRSFSMLIENDPDTVAIISVFREVQSITMSTFESLFSTLLSGLGSSSKKPALRGWALVSKLMHTTKCVEMNKKGDEETTTTGMYEIEKLDVALNTFVISCKNSTEAMVEHSVQNVQKRSTEVELSIEAIEVVLELVFKGLIKTRVSLLNILSSNN